MTVKVKRKITKPIRRVRTFKLGEGLPTPQEIRDELEDMRAVLLGHVDPPIWIGVMTLYEVAEGYYSRACDIEQQILRVQAEGRLPRASEYSKIRTLEIRSFKDMARSAAELGSRRVTAAALRAEQEKRGRESV